jgi:hypothetical protein
MFSEKSITVSLGDEAAGQFVTLSQDGNEVGFEREAWPILRKEIDAAVKRCEP